MTVVTPKPGTEAAAFDMYNRSGWKTDSLWELLRETAKEADG